MSVVSKAAEEAGSVAVRAQAPMSEAEAMRAVKDIRGQLTSANHFLVGARRKIKELYDRKGWQALGHKNWRACVEAEFGCSYSHAYRLLQAAITDEEIAPVAGDLEIPECVLRPLLALPPEAKRQVVQRAIESGVGEVPTRRQVEAAVEEFSPRGENSEPAEESEDDEPAEVRAARKAGIIPEGVKAIVEGFDEPEADEASVGPEPERSSIPAEITDDEWLATLPARTKLPELTRRRFDAEALAFRKATPARLKFVRELRSLVKEAKAAAGHHIGPWLHRFYHFVQCNDPSRWLPCTECQASGQVEMIGKCPACKGEGYHVR